jgi:RHS repeat-associated protein
MLNRSSVNDGGTITNYSFSSLNQYIGVGGLNPTYNDGNFNLTGFNGATYVYGYTSQLISASKGGNSIQFTYDGLGRCVRRVVNGAARIFTYDGWKPMLEWDGAGNWLAMNFYGAGPDEILARYDSIGRALTYKRDKQGNVVALLGNDGSVVEKYRYDAFGQPTVTDNWGNVRAGSIHENRFMFTGREWIKELGIYDYRNRFYHPGLGRFLQSDPLGLQTEGVKLTAGEKALFFGGQAPEAFSSSEMNLYRYCGDDPVDNSDPLGLADSVTIEFSPEDPKILNFAPVSQKYLDSVGGNNNKALSLMIPGEKGLVTTATRNPNTGDIHVQQKIIITTVVSQDQIKAGKLASLAKDEQKRVQIFRMHSINAQIKADNLAKEGFKDEASAKQAVEKSTKDEMIKAGKEGQLRFDR